ncbi:hypothetical protein ACOSP7_002436 [Xanthoceras sorbifolium]
MLLLSHNFQSIIEKEKKISGNGPLPPLRSITCIPCAGLVVPEGTTFATCESCLQLRSGAPHATYCTWIGRLFMICPNNGMSELPDDGSGPIKTVHFLHSISKIPVVGQICGSGWSWRARAWLFGLT